MAIKLNVGANSLNNLRLGQDRVRVRVWIVWYMDAQTAARFDEWWGASPY